MENVFGFVAVILFLILIVLFSLADRQQPWRKLRNISAFSMLKRGIGLAVESGQRLHVSLGSGGVIGIRGAAALEGLIVLNRIARSASNSDLPPIATSGEATQALLSQDSLHDAFRNVGAENQFEPHLGQLTGLTPFSYASGTLPILFDEQISVNYLSGSFGSEVGLITDAAERAGSITIGGSENITAQAILFASAQEPLIGEELYVAGAYFQANPTHIASVRAQDIFRWIVIGLIVIGAILKLFGAL